jgi:hypothetical protein
MLFKRVENNISRTDEITPWEVALPIGSDDRFQKIREAAATAIR